MDNLYKYVKLFATYSELFQRKHDREVLKEALPTLSLGGLLSILSQITYLEVNNENVKRLFKDYFSVFEKEFLGSEENKKIKLEKIDNYVLYSPQGLLSVWKWLLAYGDKNKLTEDINIDKGIFEVIYLCLIVSDYLYEKDPGNIKYEMVRNKAFNQNEDLLSSIARSKHIYIDLARNKDLYIPKEYVDFNLQFKNTYGYSLEEHFSIIVGIMTSFHKKDDIIEGNWTSNFNKYFSTTKLTEIAFDIVDSLTAEFDELTDWAKENLDNPWSFIEFRKKPLFKINKNTVLPISYKLFKEQLFEGVFHKIRACYPEDDLKFNTFFGRPYEKYIEILMEKVKNFSGQNKYEFIKEFEYDRDKKKSPDVMLKLGNQLLVIEAKSKRLTLNALEGDDHDSIEKAQEDLVLSPIKQAHDRIVEILNSNKKNVFQDIKNYYIAVVNIKDFPTLPPIEIEIKEKLEQYFDIPIKGFYHMDIKEYEMLCHLIGRKTKRPIFSILDNKYNKYPGIPFTNFLDATSLPMKRPKFIEEKGKEFFEVMKEKLFDEE